MLGKSPLLGKKPGRKLERPIRSAVHDTFTDSQADGKRYGRVRDDLKDIWLQPRRPGEQSLRDIASSERPPSSPTAAIAGSCDPIKQARALQGLVSKRRLVFAGNEQDESNQMRKHAISTMQTRNYWDSRAGKIGAPDAAADRASPAELSQTSPGFPRISPGPGGRATAFGETPQSTIDQKLEEFRRQRDAAESPRSVRRGPPPRTAPAPGGVSPLRRTSEKRVGNFTYKSQVCSAAKPYIPMENPRPSDDYFKLDRALRKLHPYEHRRR